MALMVACSKELHRTVKIRSRDLNWKEKKNMNVLDQ